MITVEQFNERGKDTLPGHLGIVITRTAPGEMHASLAVEPHHKLKSNCLKGAA